MSVQARFLFLQQKSIPRRFKKNLAKCMALVHENSSSSYRLNGIHNDNMNFKKLTTFVLYFVEMFQKQSEENKTKVMCCNVTYS